MPLLPMAETSFLTGKWNRMNITTTWSDGQVQTLQWNVQSANDKHQMCSVILTQYVYFNCCFLSDAVSSSDCTVSDGEINNKQQTENMLKEANVAEVNTVNKEPKPQQE